MSFDVKRMIKFEHNVSAKEAKVRMMVGSAALLISVFTAKIILLLVGLMLVATGYSGWCPAYSGMNKETYAADEVETPPAAE